MFVDESSTRNSQRETNRCATESVEARQPRYQERTRRRQCLAFETPEDRVIGRRQRIASETPEDRETRLSRRRERDWDTRRRRIASETAEQRETRLSTRRAQYHCFRRNIK